jgi:hypothetical protein
MSTTPHRLRVVVATMDSILQVKQALVETLAVLSPRHLIHSCRRIPSKTLVRLLEKRLLDVAQQVGPLFYWLLPRSLSHPLQKAERIGLALCRGCVFRSGLSLGLGPSLCRLDGRYPRLRRLLRYYDLVRLLSDSLPGLAAFAFPWLPAAHHWRRGIAEISRLPCR